MRKHYFFLGLIFLFNLLNANFIDIDLDGVEDSKDLCPNSKITDIVDKNGCVIETLNFKEKPHIDILLGYSIKEYSNYTSKYANLYFTYSYKDYAFNLYLTDDKDNDIETSISYKLSRDNIIYTFTSGLYIPTTSDNRVDYFTRLNMTYLNSISTIFLDLEYDFMQDINSKNGYIISFGVGKNLTNNIYSSISYRYISSIYQDSSNEKYLSFTFNYNIDSNWYISSSLDIGLNSSSIKRAVDFNIGYSY